MNKLTKIGVSALCGSLAGISAANAGDLTVSGGADMTWMSKDDAVVGNPLGIGSNYTFSGSGELDNGWNVSLSIANANANAYSNTNIVIGVPGLGDIRVDQGVSGTGVQRYDDITPTVWEEADGAGLSAGINKISGVSAGPNIEVTPTDLMPAGLTARFAWSPDADAASTTGDKATGGDSGVDASGWDITLEGGSDLHGVDGLTVYAGMSQVDRYINSSGNTGDREEEFYGVKYAMGGFTVGYQVTKEDTGKTGTTEYENTSYGITFNVNDDLSIGYGHTESSASGGSANPEADSIQVAYTMGGATFRIAEVDVENQSYSAAATGDLSATVISLGLAF
jgi:outer membrane protein OmpU